MNYSKGWTYFILDSTDRQIKIGRTNSSPHKRLAQLQTGNPTRLVLLGMALEKEVHKVFSHLHVADEWFRMDGELIDFIERVAIR